MKIRQPIGKSWKILLLTLVLTNLIKSCFCVKDPPLKYHCMSSAHNPLAEAGVAKAAQAIEDSGAEWEFTDKYKGDVLSVVGCKADTFKKIYYSFAVVDDKDVVSIELKPSYTSYGCDQVTMDQDWLVTCDYYTNSIDEDCLSSTVTSRKPLKGLLNDGALRMRIELLDSVKIPHSRCIFIEVTFVPKSSLGYVLGDITPDTEGLDDLDCKLYYYFGIVFSSLAVTLLLLAFLPIQSHPEIEFVENGQFDESYEAEDEDDDDDSDDD